MSRAHINYAEHRATQAVQGGVDVTTPEAGYFKLKLSRDTVLRAVRIWYGPPADPITGELLDRAWRWQAQLDDGDLVDFDRAWPQCARDPIPEAEWKRCCARVEWAREHAPDSSYAERGRRRDPLSSSEPLPF